MTLPPLSPPPLADRLVRKLDISVPLSGDEVAALRRLADATVTVPPATDLVVQGQGGAAVHILEDGWAIRYKLLSDGRRQILNIVLPGDFIGLREQLFEVADHSVTTLNEAVVSRVRPEAIIELFRRYPKLTAALVWSAAREEALLEEHVVRIGRRSAYERLAHLFLELHKRLQAVGLAGPDGFLLPLTQETLADLLGLSVVHVNRTLRRFQREGLLSVEGGRLSLVQPDTLARIADFGSAYLKQGRLDADTRSKLSRLR